MGFSTKRKSSRRTAALFEALEPRQLMSATLPMGVITAGSITGAGQSNQYSFTVPQGADAQIDTIGSRVDAGFTANFSLVRSNVGSVDKWWNNNPEDRNYQNLTAGTYVLTVNDYSGKWRGGYDIGLEGISPANPKPTPLTWGGITSGSITQALGTSELSFTLGSAGVVKLSTDGAAVDSGFTAEFSLYGSNGAKVIPSWWNNNAQTQSPMSLPAGTYMIEVKDYGLDHRGSFAVGLNLLSGNFSPGIQPLSRGGIVSGTIGQELATQQFSFSVVSASSLVEFKTDGTRVDAGFTAKYAVYNSAGTLVQPAWWSNNEDTRTMTLPAGKYMIEMSDYGATYRGGGSIGLEFLSAPFSHDAIPLPAGSAVTGTIASELDTHELTFAATGTTATFVTAGTRTDAGFTAAFDVLDSNGIQKGAWWNNNSEKYTVTGLTPNANYVLVVSDYGSTYRGSFSVTATGVRPVTFAPEIGSLLTSASSATNKSSVTLTASGLADLGNDLSQVVFYRESNGKSGLQTGTGGDIVVGTDSSASGGYTTTFSTTALAPGNYTFYAQALDTNGALGDIVSVKVTIT